MANASKADGRSSRRARVVPFLSHLDRSCQANLAGIVQLARTLMTQFPGAVWEDATWAVTGGRLVKQPGKNNKKADLKFAYSPKLGMGSAQPLEAGFAELVKALVTLRFHRNAQATSNQRQFIHALSFVAYVVREGGRAVADITPGDFEEAAHLIGRHYAESTGYQMQKGLGEIAAHLDANSLCKVRLDWKYSQLRRPSSAGGVGMKRLDDPSLDDETATDKMVSETVYRLIALLSQRMPSGRRGRMYVLMLTLFACLGRRFSEIAYLPDQVVEKDRDGNAFITYFKRKASQGDTYTPSEKLPLPTEAAPIVADAIAEVRTLCEPARETAREMHRVNGPDLRFLDTESASTRFGGEELKGLGLSPSLLNRGKTTGGGWLSANGWARRGYEYTPGRYRWFTSLEGIKAYCRRDFHPSMIEAVHIDQFGKKFYPEDMLFLQNAYLGGVGESSQYAHWLAGTISHVMLSKWLIRQLPILAREYAPEVAADLDFTSHMFRHTVNTLLDEGGLPELVQTQWFGRGNPRDTKAYQHTSREKRVKEVRDALLAGEAEGVLADQLEVVPFEKHKAFVTVSVRAVHDVGTGICVHDFAQTPCERHLQCQADCQDYVYAKSDPGRISEIKRMWAFAMIQLDLANKQQDSNRPRKSADWIAHQNKKLRTLERQMQVNGIEPFDPHEYVEEVAGGEGDHAEG